MRNCNQFTQTERYQIYALRKANKNPTEISRVLGRHKSTIYRELKRNLGKRGYRAVQAHQFAVERHMSRDRRRISLEDWQLVESLIRRDWSPEQISLWLKINKKNQGQSRVDLSVYFEGYVPSRRSLHSLALKEKTQKTLRQSEPQRNDFKPGFD